MTTRRGFLKGFGAAGAGLLVGGCEIEDVARFVDDRRSVARLGVIAHTEVPYGPDPKWLERTFLYYRQEGVDAVVIAGGVTKTGLESQFEIVRRMWSRIFAGTGARLITEEGRAEVNGFPFRVSARTPFEKSDVIVFHAGGKFALTDELMFYDRTYRSVCAGSMNGVKIQKGYEYHGAESKDDLVPARQGLLVGVYSGKVVIRRLDFMHTEPVEKGLRPRGIYVEDVADALELGLDGSSPKVKSAAPEFWPDTVVRAIPGFLGAQKLLTVKWPHLLKKYVGVRAHSYEVCAYLVESDGSRSPVPFVRKRVFSNGFMLAESRDTDPVACLLPVADAKGARVVVSVTPVGYYGDLGKPVFTPPIDC